MDKQPIALLIADTHLSEHTVEQNLSVFAQVTELCKSLGISTFIHLGDCFTSRKGQPEIVLTTFKNILDQLAQSGLMMLTINGNHDKTRGEAESSFLDAFNGHSAFSVVGLENVYNVGSVNFFFLPYFDEHLTYPSKLVQLNQLVQVNEDSINLLITHCAIDGVTNNSALKVKGELPTNGFEKFNTVFVGHYHNRQSFNNIVYTGSTDPRNFGEDDQKGVTVIYDDGSYEFINLEFKPYVTVDLLSSDLTLDVINRVKEKSKEAHLRFRIQGEVNEQLKPMIAQLNESDVKIEVHKEIVVNESGQQDSQVTFTSGDIIELYNSWSEDRKIENKEFGEKLLRDRV